MKKLNEFHKVANIKDLLNQSAEKFADRPAYIFKTDKPGEFRTTKFRELKEDVDALGTSLISMGLEGKRIAVISENRYEWNVAYLAVTCGTGVVVPLDKALPANEIESLIIRSGVEAIFFSKAYNDIMKDIRTRGTTDLRYYISMDAEEKQDAILSL